MRKFTVHAKRAGYNVSFIRTLTTIEGNITPAEKWQKKIQTKMGIASSFVKYND